MSRFLLPLLGVVIFYSESIFATFSPIEVAGDTRMLVPRFLVVFLLFLSFYYDRNVSYIYAFALGFMYDVFFTGIMGIYMFLFPLLIYLSAMILRLIFQNIAISGVVTLVMIALLEWLVYQFNLLIGIADLNIHGFLTQRLYSTLLFNAAFILIAAYPFKIWMTALKYRHLED
ncbi:rod shape-determining protein MreD [Jeotgalibacillus haloalkalitolerans]|uniref:Rod shape-determining protein MreD n=1 Tax=Jeotgalibacillus haloalkalitolerans TaxID=3104292 RepID=A0ABU5KM76_9BACL|nr:rod shape-determining protein MreD [Jeotgalibacillus sp. HH7-29]MDZ5712356.1 rod shape-determining protein MreD [Jeotgalibacillus sp. HH7-29]